MYLWICILTEYIITGKKFQGVQELHAAYKFTDFRRLDYILHKQRI